MVFLNIAIILRILLVFFQVFYAIFRDFLGFWDLVRFWDFSKDFLGFLMKCTNIFRVICPSMQTTLTGHEENSNTCTYHISQYYNIYKHITGLNHYLHMRTRWLVKLSFVT